MLVAATVAPTLTDAELDAALVIFALADGNDRAPGSSGWTEVYDMNGAAAECIRWKLARAVNDVTQDTDGAAFNLSDVTKHLQDRLKDFEGRRQTGTFAVFGRT